MNHNEENETIDEPTYCDECFEEIVHDDEDFEEIEGMTFCGLCSLTKTG